MNAETVISPPPETDAAWAAATERVERYLRAHRLAAPTQVSRLAADIIGIARARPRAGVDPVTQAMETLDACMGEWFARLLPAGDVDDAELLTRGRLALSMGEVPARWPAYFLRVNPVPAELVRVMREADLGQAPKVHFTNMAPRMIAGPAAATARSRWQVSLRWPFLRIVTGVVLVVSFLGAAWPAGL